MQSAISATRSGGGLPQKEKEQAAVSETIKHRIQTVKEAKAVPQLKQVIKVNRETFTFEVDTGAGDNFCAEATWKKLVRPALTPTTNHYEVANGQPLPILGYSLHLWRFRKMEDPVYP